MKQIIIFTAIALFFITGCNSTTIKVAENKASMDSANCEDDCCKPKTKIKDTSAKLACKLTSPELRQRKATVIASLKKQMIESKEITNGYVFNFSGNDQMLDEIMEFIKTERQCCDFFTFNLSVSNNTSEIWLEMTGKDGVKDFIKTELGLDN